MALKETKNQPKDLIEPIPEEVEKLDISEEKSEEATVVPTRKDYRTQRDEERDKRNLEAWMPKTKLGKLAKEGKLKDIDEILKHHKKILEPEIVDSLLHLESDLLLIGQSKGKFGGGKRRAWRQTQKKTMEGNVITFSTMVVVGDKNGHVGLGYGRAKETLPAREKAARQAKLNLIKIHRGFEDPADSAKHDLHTVPFRVEGKCGALKITLLPAPRGTGLVIGDEGKKIMRLAGIKDVYSRTSRGTRTTFNFAKACLDALRKTTEVEQ